MREHSSRIPSGIRKYIAIMKKKSLFTVLAAVGLLSGSSLVSSCEDMMSPGMDRYTTDFNGKDTVSFYLGIMRNMQELVENNALMGELRGDLVATTDYTSDSIANIINFNNPEDGSSVLLNSAAYYKVINQCNFYLNKVDTMSSKNGYYYMRRETGQVLAVRAWTYLQLVQTYGEVPFITQPVSDANTGLETSAPKINADNLVDLLEGDLLRSIEYQNRYGMVDYGNFDTGAQNVTSKLMNFPAHIVLADLYLLRGASVADFEAAATHYYEFLKNSRSVELSGAGYTKFGDRNNRTYIPGFAGWVDGVSEWSNSNYTSNTGKVVTAIPSAANSSFGYVMDRVPNIFGFSSFSTSNTSAGSTADKSTTSGNITLTADYRLRQVGPSESYRNLNEAQNYVDYERPENTGSSSNDLEVIYPENLGDARYAATVPGVRTEKGNIPFISKFCGTSSSNPSVGSFGFRYVTPVYRINQIYLRFAEAVNRAGFPRHAFAILRDGLGGANTFNGKQGSVSKMPSITFAFQHNDVDSTSTSYRCVTHVENGLDYLGYSEIYRAQSKPFLDFSHSRFDNFGIHELGSGESGDLDTAYTYKSMVSRRILDEAKRMGNLTPEVEAFANSIKNERYTEVPDPAGSTPIDRSGYKKIYPDSYPLVMPTIYEVNAVETLILDEMALETAYEGSRMADLIRVARHKNASGADGNNWLAWKIARRNLNLAPYANPEQYDATLFGKLQNVSNWYLRLNP